MNPKSIIACGAAVVLGVISGIIIQQRYSARGSTKIQRAQKTFANSQPAPVESSPIQPRTPQISPKNLAASASPPTVDTPAAASPAKDPLQDPLARDALALVGADPDAELYWFAAINDLSLPANEREDLIEDLNEEGLPDPKHPTIDDLPLILNRLALIEAVGPDAADEVNADAFAEAYKDLLNLAQVAMGGGEPVR